MNSVLEIDELLLYGKKVRQCTCVLMYLIIITNNNVS